MNSSSATNNQLLAEGLVELEKLKSQIARLSAQETAFKAVASSIKDIEKATKVLDKKLTNTITDANKKMQESVAAAASGLDTISAKNEKLKWRITWVGLGLIAITEIAIAIIIVIKI